MTANKITECIGCGAKDLPPYEAPEQLCGMCLRARALYESGNIPSSKPTLKLFQVLIHFPNQGQMPNIEMIILESNKAEVGSTVRRILTGDGYDAGEAMMTTHEIEGPFGAGFIVARHGG